jgi:hypothetical protein
MLILNLGCGINRRRLYQEPFPEGTVHIDRSDAVGPDIVWDLNLGLPMGALSERGVRPGQVDEIHAYHLIEHIGVMGDTRVWFQFWRDCWTALKPGGLVYVIAPWFQHEDAVGDPTHTRLICKQTYHFLDRRAYLRKEGELGCAMSKLAIDFDFRVLEHKFVNKAGELVPCSLATVLQAVKTERGELVPLETENKEAATV